MPTKAEVEQRLAKAETQNKQLRMKLASKEVSGLPIEEVFKSENGNSYRFEDGHVFIRMKSGEKVLTEEIVKMANDPDYVPGEEALIRNARLAKVSNKEAKDLLESLVVKKYGYLNQVAEAEEK